MRLISILPPMQKIRNANEVLGGRFQEGPIVSYLDFVIPKPLTVVPHCNLHVFILSDTDQSFNKVAERVLMRLQEKLKGVEEGTVLSVGGQVNLLIQQAMDPKKLSRLFPGWKAWV